MADDIYVYTPPPDPFDGIPPSPPPVDEPRTFGGLGKARAAILLAAGLILGGGIGGFVIASAATSPSPSATSSPSPSAGTTHPCPNMGHGTTSTAYYSY